MSAFDVGFLALAVLAVMGGFRLGFVARVGPLDRRSYDRVTPVR